MTRRRTGFTLVELLVVVGIIALLIALLLPALNRARAQAKLVVCLSNIRQMDMAFTMYLGDNKGHSLRYDATYDTFWMNVLRPTYGFIKDIRFCPQATQPSYGWGTALLAWGPYDAAKSPYSWMAFFQDDSASYGFNGYMHDPQGNPGGAGAHATNDLQPELIPVFADANWVDGWPSPFDPVPPNLYVGSQLNDPNMGRFCVARHGKSINVAFLDGHAENVSLSRLWDLNWSSNWAAPPTPVHVHDPP